MQGEGAERSFLRGCCTQPKMRKAEGEDELEEDGERRERQEGAASVLSSVVLCDMCTSVRLSGLRCVVLRRGMQGGFDEVESSA